VGVGGVALVTALPFSLLKTVAENTGETKTSVAIRLMKTRLINSFFDTIMCVLSV
jgi:hypothetical protein